MKKILVSLALLIAANFFTGCGKNYTVIQSLYPNDTQMWEHIFETKDPYKFGSAPFGVIIPHHLIAAVNIAKFYGGLKEVINPSVIVIIGPNHFEKSPDFEDIKTCQTCLYETTKGSVEIDEDLSEKIVDDGVAFLSEDYFLNEHAIFSHTPFIKNYFPDAKILPILTNWQIPIDKAQELGDWLNENLPADSLVIASVDFSHYVPDGVADFHDKSSFTTITNFDYQNVYDLELDSPSSIYTLLYLMEKRGYMKSEMLAHTNLTDFLTEYEEETTSHLYFAFYKGEMVPTEGVSILSFGNLPKDQTLTFNKGWQFFQNNNDSTKLLRDIRAKEDRFLIGSDFLVFNLPNDQCLKEEQNGMEVSFCKFIENAEKEKEFLKIIKEEAKESDVVYLLFEYTEYGELDEDRKAFTRSLIKSGVDIFVGRGLKEVIPFETYKGSLIFHSLGDFIIDNKLVTDLNAFSSGMVLGLYVTPEEYEIYTFPVIVENGYPKMTDFSKRQTLFNIFKEDADLGRKDETDAEKGTIKIKR